jgi:hypothetical protein
MRSALITLSAVGGHAEIVSQPGRGSGIAAAV